MNIHKAFAYIVYSVHYNGKNSARRLPNLLLAGLEFLFNIHNDLIGATVFFFHDKENYVIYKGSVDDEFVYAILSVPIYTVTV